MQLSQMYGCNSTLSGDVITLEDGRKIALRRPQDEPAARMYPALYKIDWNLAQHFYAMQTDPATFMQSAVNHYNQLPAAQKAGYQKTLHDWFSQYAPANETWVHWIDRAMAKNIGATIAWIQIFRPESFEWVVSLFMTRFPEQYIKSTIGAAGQWMKIDPEQAATYIDQQKDWIQKYNPEILSQVSEATASNWSKIFLAEEISTAAMEIEKGNQNKMVMMIGAGVIGLVLIMGAAKPRRKKA